MLRATKNQGRLVQSVEGGAVVAGRVGILAHDAENIDGGWCELMEDKGAERVRNSLLAVEVLAQVAGKDTVPVGAVHDMVVVLWTGAVHGPGDGGTGVSDVVYLNVHRAPETRCGQRLSFPICAQAASISEDLPQAFLALRLWLAVLD